MIAMLGMYDMPAIQPVNDRYWQAIRDHLGHGPARLTRDMDYFEMWESPDLVLGQTCGLPYRSRLHDRVQKIATPDYALDGCPAGHYRSLIVIRAGETPDLAAQNGRRFAYNETVSQSGWAGPMTFLAASGVTPGQYLGTGGHVKSAHAIARNEADFAGIDALTWALIRDHDPVADGLQVIAATPSTPGLPYICAPGQDAAALRAAISAAMADIGAADRRALHLTGLTDIPLEDYLNVATPTVQPV
jgi:ABC-type phosphate/phosphonate transport system substrate-binding protein